MRWKRRPVAANITSIRVVIKVHIKAVIEVHIKAVATVRTRVHIRAVIKRVVIRVLRRDDREEGWYTWRDDTWVGYTVINRFTVKKSVMAFNFKKAY